MSNSKLLGTPEAFSLFGEPLYPRPIRLWLPTDQEAYAEKLRQLNADYEASQQEYRENPTDPDKIVWLGRRAGILGRFREAIAVYSKGIELHPDDPRPYRFRGHRYAVMRRIEQGIRDLEKAAELIEGRPDEPEFYASGGRSEDKLGVSGFHWNVWYHLGFARIAAGRFQEAVEAYRRCMEVADNLESVIATTHWLYMPLIRLGRLEEAEKLLEPIEADRKVVEVGDYYQTLLMYKGKTTPEELLEQARGEGPARFLTRGQAVANLYMAQGKVEDAVNAYREVVASGEWTAGVHLISEAELKRLNLSP